MSALRAHLATGVTTVCRAWVLQRTDGTVLGFTDHDRDLTVEGVTCRAASGFAAGAVEAGTGLAVDNASVTGALTGTALGRDDLRAGRWDGAAVTAYRVNWAAPDEAEIAFRGHLGEIAERDGAFSAELRGLSAALNVRRGRVFQARCDARFGDARCGVDTGAAGLTVVAAVAAVSEGGRILSFASDDLASSAHGFADGSCTFLDGGAVGLRERIGADVAEGGARRLALRVAPRTTVSVGDRVRLTVGCDKAMATCAERYGNVVNFRGFPHVPPDDWQVAGPPGGGR